MTTFHPECASLNYIFTRLEFSVLTFLKCCTEGPQMETLLLFGKLTKEREHTKLQPKLGALAPLLPRWRSQLQLFSLLSSSLWFVGLFWFLGFKRSKESSSCTCSHLDKLPALLPTIKTRSLHFIQLLFLIKAQEALIVSKSNIYPVTVKTRPSVNLSWLFRTISPTRLSDQTDRQRSDQISPLRRSVYPNTKRSLLFHCCEFVSKACFYGSAV